MRILKIRLKNIHSLKGEHEIDFTIPPLMDSGLFAITGPTGAGKSTILDVITLALFNKIPRFTPRGTEKITKGEIEKSGSVMTHLTDDAYAEVEYLSNDKTYRSTWKIAKARTGNLKDYEMTLASLPDETYLDLKNSEVPQENEKIIGLNYDQFIRSILLSQGEFSKFLKSDEKERAKLLEDITGSQLYRTIGQIVYRKHKEKNEAIVQLKNQISNIRSFTVEELDEKANLLVNFKQKIIDIVIVSKKKNDTLTLMQRKLELEQKLTLLSDEIKALEVRKTKFAAQEMKLEKHLKLNPIRNDLTLLKNEEQRVSEANLELESLKIDVKKHQSSLQLLWLEIHQLTGKGPDAASYLNILQDFQQEVLKLDEQLVLLQENGITKRAQLNKILEAESFSITKSLLEIKNISTQKEMASVRQKVLANRPFKQMLPNDELKTKILESQDKLLVTTKKAADIETRESLIKELGQIESIILEHNKSIESASLKIANIDIESKVLQEQITELTKLKEAQLKIISLENHREQLTEGEACPLCGSTEHPYIKHQALLQLGQSTFDLSAQQSQMQSLNAQLLEQKELLASTKAKIEKDKEQKANKTLTIDKINKIWEDEKVQIVASEVYKEIEKIKAIISKYSQELNDRAEFSCLVDALEVLEELIMISDKYLSTAQQKKEKYEGDDVKSKTKYLQNQVLSAINNIQANDTNQASVIKLIQQLQKSIEERKTSIEPNLKSLGYENIDHVYADILDEEEAVRLSSEKELINTLETETKTKSKSLTKDLEVLDANHLDHSKIEEFKTEIKALQTENDNLNHQMGAIENELKRDKENKSEIGKIQQSLQKKEVENKDWYLLDQLIGDATGNKYAKYAQNLSLKVLIEFANKRLVQLSDRYLLESANIEDDLKIIDLYQGNITRSVKTLSGGESFIVSLALALSLADMASKNVRLESLFIDEGFGTLDSETLETALATLEKLQSESNRIIGIISHVDSLKDRITTQIKVHKSNLGYSTIEITN